MRALFKDKNDGTLFVAELSRVVYLPEPDGNMLYCITASKDDILIQMSPNAAENAIKTLFEHDKVDFSDYEAEINTWDEHFNTED